MGRTRAIETVANRPPLEAHPLEAPEPVLDPD